MNTESLKGKTPPIKGEHFTITRGYKLRPSTLRKLMEIKSSDPDVNIYLNTILDRAINHYYNALHITPSARNVE